MYERSAIVLERYFNDILGFNQKINLKTNYKNYESLVEEMGKYIDLLMVEEEAINEFDNMANGIREIQREQKKLHSSNENYEQERDNLFESLAEDTEFLTEKLEKVEESIELNNARLIELKEIFIDKLEEFKEKQQDRNKISRERRLEEANHLQIIKQSTQTIEDIDINVLRRLKQFVTLEDTEKIEEKILEVMIENGKDERIGFDEEVLKKAIRVRCDIAKKEAECYLLAFDKIRKLLAEIDKDEVKISKYDKSLRDLGCKIEFLNAEKVYVIGFLDNERMTAMNGNVIHTKMMKEACENFEKDMEQINNLYQLLLREIIGKSAKKIYKELYNKGYLANIEAKEKSFEEEITSINIRSGAIINSNYWRIDGIKNIYSVFEKEVTTYFDQDLSEFDVKVELPESIIEDDIFEIKDDKEKIKKKEEMNSQGSRHDDIDKILDYDFIDKISRIEENEEHDEIDMNEDDFEEVDDEEDVENEENTDNKKGIEEFEFKYNDNFNFDYNDYLDEGNDEDNNEEFFGEDDEELEDEEFENEELGDEQLEDEAEIEFTDDFEEEQNEEEQNEEEYDRDRYVEYIDEYEQEQEKRKKIGKRFKDDFKDDYKEDLDYSTLLRKKIKKESKIQGIDKQIQNSKGILDKFFKGGKR